MTGVPLLAMALLPSPAIATGVKQCGWVENPTPGNWSLKDNCGTWILSEQGGYSADGLDTLPDMSGQGWVNENGSHGCGCIEIETGLKRHVKRLDSAKSLPIKTCRVDRKLPPP